MEDPKAKIERILNGPTEFRLGDYISRGFEIFQKDMGSFIGFALIFFVLTTVIGLIPIVGSVATQLVISPALTVGIYLFANKLDRGERPEFGTFFKGFDFTPQLVLAALVMGLIILASLVPFGLVIWKSGWIEWYTEVVQNPGTPPTDFPELPPAWTFLLLIPAIFFGIAYAWTYLFIAFYKLEFWDAMEASRRLLTRHWPIYFLFTIIIGLIAGLGFILFCVGILATFPAVICMTYAAFADVTKLNEAPQEGEGIEQHLIE